MSGLLGIMILCKELNVSIPERIQIPENINEQLSLNYILNNLINNIMAILNFQKPDKVIMIESSDRVHEGRFEFRPLRTWLRINSWKCIKKSFIIFSRRFCNYICKN